MFSIIGKLVARSWPVVLVVWIAALVALKLAAPPWDQVITNGEFAFLPPDSQSRLGEELFQKAWDEPLASNVVVVVRRESSENGLIDSDKTFIDDVLKVRLEAIADEESPSLQPETPVNLAPNPANADEDPAPSAIAVRTFSDKSVGRLLDSSDRKASLVLVELPTEFLDARNSRLIERIENLIGQKGELQTEGLVPRGLDLALSGSATVGRDMLVAAHESSRDTELWTVLLVVALLIAIYRAPLMALIPLVTVGVSTEISLALLALLAKGGLVGLFSGIEVYVKVLSYGAGVDYCLFLIARYKEELDEGATFDQAVENSLSKVGHALAASAGTVICGIGMMVFAEFGKFREAGVAISLGLVIVLIAALTFSASLLRAAQRWAFWPKMSGTQLAQSAAGWVTATSLWSRILERNWGQLLWNHVSQLVRVRPGAVLLTSVLVMLPFAWIGVQFHSYLSYGLLSELPKDRISVVGSEAVSLHFPPGIGGPMTILVKSNGSSFLDDENGQLTGDATALVENLTEALRDHQDRLQVADIRTLLHPYGGGLASQDSEPSANNSESSPIQLTGGSGIKNALARRIEKQKTLNHYVSPHGDLKGQVLRLDVVLQEDPFARNSIQQFESIRHEIEAVAAPRGLQVFALGPTASIRDLKGVTDRDQIRIDILVLGGVFLILIALLRRFTISLYLIISVFFSYLVTLGVTFAFFWLLEPGEFAGLDWKVPMFLFTILIAVGEDYNIFLMTRIDEEQSLHGPLDGVISALQKTGSIISSCGIIMAGTFCSLLAGSLVGMQQLGFALAFGVLLDTFVVRPILVPAFLVLLHDGRLTSFSRLVGSQAATAVPDAEPAPVSQTLDLGGK